MKKVLVAAFLAFASLGFAADPENNPSWIELATRFSYTDLDSACSNYPSPGKTFLAYELDQNLKVVRAMLKYGDLGSPIAPQITFEGEELQGIVLKDGKGPWLQSLGLSERMLFWIFEHPSAFASDCKPAAKLGSVTPAPVALVFSKLFPGEMGGFASSTAVTRFSGKREDGQSYSATLQLEQRQVWVP